MNSPFKPGASLTPPQAHLVTGVYHHHTMLDPLSPLTLLLRSLVDGAATPSTIAQHSLLHANSNASRNTYLWHHPSHLLQQAAALEQANPRLPLWSVPISLKDCFDLAGTPTTCGSRFYSARGPVTQDSAIAASLRKAGALITGKTHLHPLAYGITGENPEYGDCLQPRDPTLLTGGSSSGAAASVQEGSALAAIGTDTGGSIRVPAALCGLVGYRSSHRLIRDWFPLAWQGAAHLAPSFDTLGLLLRDPRDVAPLAQALFHIPSGTAPQAPRIGYAPLSFLHDCEPGVLDAYSAWQQQLAACGAHLEELPPDTIQSTGETPDWDEAFAIFAPIQAHEAAQIHAGHIHHSEPSIRERLLWGASLQAAELAVLQERLAAFLEGMQALFDHFDLLMLPASPVSTLLAGADHAHARGRILRYTAPFSLARLPALSLPGEVIGAARGTGIQLAAAPGADAMLLAFAERIGQSITLPTA